jgi:cellulase/cellobiase CelA1
MAQTPATPLVRFVVGATWSSGYGAEITLTNRGTTAYTAWTLQWDNGPTIASMWNGTHSVSGVQHTVTNASMERSARTGRDRVDRLQRHEHDDEQRR